jgi:CHAT domain-containing protein
MNHDLNRFRKIARGQRQVVHRRNRNPWRYLLIGCLAWGWVLVMSPLLAPGMAQVNPIQVNSTQGSSAITQSTPGLVGDSGNALERGQIAYQTGVFTDAIAFWQQATQDYAQTGDWLNQALSLSYLSLAQQQLGQWDAAAGAIAHSLELLQSQPALDQNGMAVLAQAWTTQGKLSLHRGDVEGALEQWQQAEVVYAQVGDRQGIWGSHINQAQALQTLGYYQQARQLLEQVYGDIQVLPASTVQVAGLRSLGTVWQRVGDLEESRQVLEEGLAIARQLDIPAETSATLFALGNTMRALADPEIALQLYQQAAAIAPADLERLRALVNQLSLWVELERWSEANELLTTLLPDLTNLSPSRPGIALQVNAAVSWMTGLIQQQRNQQPDQTSVITAEQIARLLTQALHQAQELQDVRAMSQVQGQLGKLYMLTAQWAIAADLTVTAAQQAQSIEAGEILYRWQAQLAQIRRQQGDRDGALAAYGEAIATLQGIRGDLLALNAEVQTEFASTVEPIYRDYIDLLVPASATSEIDTEQALDAVENFYLFQQTSGNQLDQAIQTIEGLRLAELEQFLRSACLETNAHVLNEPNSADNQTAVIYPIILEQRLVVLLSIPDAPLTAYSVPISNEDLEQSINQMLQSLNPIFGAGERLRYSQQIYDLLLKPAMPSLTEHAIETLVFVLDGELRNIPLAALYDGSHYLVEQFAIALSPGMQLLPARSPTISEQPQVLFGGLTEARQGFVALPGVAAESQQIAAQTSARIMMDQQFNQENLQTSIENSDYSYIHLATHGQFSSDPNETFLLTWDDRLTIDQLRTLMQNRTLSGNPIDLLILSACETAVGDTNAALGLAGLAVRSGARSTLATLWAVNDASTAAFMTNFYHALIAQGQSKAQALRQAQLELMQLSGYQHPYYWAPFVLVGDWQ